MKKVFAVLLVLVVLGLAGCDLNSVTWEDMLGEWDFPDGTHVSVMQDSVDSSIKQLDIDYYDPSTTEWFCYADGTANGTRFTGTYGYNKTDSLDSTNNTSGSGLTITVTLSLENNKLKVVCTGSTPLGGYTFSSGTK